MNHFKVYLAGPISGTSYEACTDWRYKAEDQLFQMSDGAIRGYSPMRHKESLAENMSQEDVIKDSYENTLLSSQRGITARDRYDCMRADLVLVNVLKAVRPSLGTTMEIAWADARRIPIVLVMEKTGNPHDHAMIRECCAFITPDLNVGIRTTFQILCP